MSAVEEVERPLTRGDVMTEREAILELAKAVEVLAHGVKQETAGNSHISRAERLARQVELSLRLSEASGE